MMRRHRWGVGIFCVINTLVAHAALGGLEQDVAREGQPAQSPTVPSQAFAILPQSIHQQTIIDSRGTTVTEFSYAGKVFALRWSGPTIPDYRRYLSTYFPQYEQALQSRPLEPGRYRAPVAVRQPHLVVHASGHMGAYQGSVYDPTATPTNFSPTSMGIDP